MKNLIDQELARHETDAQFIKRIKTITDPLEMLAAIVAHEDLLGFDKYYARLRAVLLTQAEKIVTGET
jgi:hypothetical protein